MKVGRAAFSAAKNIAILGLLADTYSAMTTRGANAHELRLRLQNCLQTILELKSDLGAVPFGASFMPELGSLEQFLAKIENVELNEAEVRRVELATDKFLDELRSLMAHGHKQRPGNMDVLQ